MIKNFRLILFLFAAVLIFVLRQDIHAQQLNWVKVPVPTGRILNSCHFLDYNTGWIAGDSGLILKTTNAGSTWIFQHPNTFLNLEKIFFLNSNTGYSIAWNVFPDSTEFLGTLIFKTTNGGDSWAKSAYPDTNTFLRDIYFVDANTGFVCGLPIVIAKTTNAGATWFKTDADTTNIGLPVFAVRFLNHQIGYASGGFRDLAGAMWWTTNGGLNWLSQIVAPEPLTDLIILSPQKCVAVGGDFEFGSSYVKTTNGGSNWLYDTLGTFGVALAVDFRTQSEGWITIGTSQQMSYTLDGAFNWTNVFSPDSAIITDIDFTDSLHAWAIGYFGAVYKYDGTMSSINSDEGTSIADDFLLEQNFPNPFNPETKITFRLNSSGTVEFRIYDISGKLVDEVAAEKLSAGLYTKSFDLSIMAAGSYLCKATFTSGSSSVSKVIKMLLVK